MREADVTRDVNVEKIRAVPILNMPLHDVVYATATGADGKIYLGVSSEFGAEGYAHLMAYDPVTDRLADLIDLRTLFHEEKNDIRPPHSKIHTTLCVGRDGIVWFASHVTAPPKGERFHRIFEVMDDAERGYRGSHVVTYNPQTGAVRDYGTIIPREGCRWMTLDLERDELHLVSYPRSHYIVFRPRTGERLDLGRISQYEALGPTWSANGFTYTTDDDGYILCYDPDRERIDQFPIHVPDAPWRDSIGNRVRRMKAGPDGVRLYGFGTLATHLFEYDPTDGPYGHMTDFGILCGSEACHEPSMLPPGKALTFGKDGQIYCGMGSTQMSIGNDLGAHIVSLDPQTRQTVDHGRLTVPGLPAVNTTQDMTTGLDGTIYIGVAVSDAPLFLLMFHPQGALPAAAGERERGAWVQTTRPRTRPTKRDMAAWEEYLREAMSLTTAFVSEGGLIARELGWFGKTPVIPPGESSITALAMCPNRKLYGLTSGERSHLFVYDPAADRTGVWAQIIDLGVLAEGSVAGKALVNAGDGKLYAGTASERGEDGHLYCHDPAAELPAHTDTMILPYEIYGPGQVTDLGAPVPGQGIAALAAAAPPSQLIYGVTTPDSYFFVYDLQAGAVMRQVHVPSRFPSQALVTTADGAVFGAADQGRLFRYDPVADSLTLLDAWLPCSKGREYLNGLHCAVLAPDGRIYGGTRSEGYLFRFDPATLEMTNLGKPTRLGRITALTAGRDGNLYGVSGEDDGLAHLFRYEVGRGNLVDLGLPRATLPREWTGYAFAAAVTGPSGEIYLGEADRISHLFTYFPPCT